MASLPRTLETAIGVGIVVVLGIVFFLSGGHAGGTRVDHRHGGHPDTTSSGSVRLSRLPVEARQTVLLIRRGGPFPYHQDGAVFENREGHLPPQPRGYYHEYTVRTPGSADRGARRIVAGQGGQLFWTDDHYRTFKRIIGTG